MALLARLPSAARAGRAAVVLALLVAAFLPWALDPAPVQALRLAQFDQFQRWHPRPPGPPYVTVVDIDETSLRALGQWPWPRTQLAALIDRLAAGEPEAIGLDILLAEPDRTSAPAPGSPAAAGTVHDQQLARALAGRPVVLGASLAREALPVAPPSPGQVPARIVVRGEPAGPWLQAYQGAVWPLAPLAQAAAGVGLLNQAPDGDGVVRRVPLLARAGDALVPGLALETWRLAQRQSNLVLTVAGGGVQSVRAGTSVVPSTPEGEFWIHYAGTQARRVVPAAQVLRDGVAPGSLRGQVVLLGSSAAGLMDLRISPLGERMPGVLAHAEALEQMRGASYLVRPDWARGLEGVLLAALAAALCTLALAAPVRWAMLGLAVALATLGAGAWLAFLLGGVLLDAIVPGLSVLAAFACAAAVQYRATERRQRFLRLAFARYVSPNRVEHLLRHPDLLHLGGRRQMCSFVFTDLAGFTAMMEWADPAQAVALLNGYLDGMLGVVFRHEGTVDRIVGDAIAVLFSAPMEQPDHQRRALACALELHAFARRHAAGLRAQGTEWGDTRIGVHCGEVIVGNFGGERLFDYRALGDPVNTAARLESVNKHLGTWVCASAELLAACPDAVVRPVGRLVLKGKQRPLEVATPEAATTPDWAPAADYASCLERLRAGQAGAALQGLQALADRHPGDPLVALHLRRLRDGALDDLIVMDAK